MSTILGAKAVQRLVSRSGIFFTIIGEFIQTLTDTFRGGKTKGSCFPNSFSGETGKCGSTPPECQDCNTAISCQDETRTPTPTPTQTCRCNRDLNTDGNNGFCTFKINGRHFCYVDPGDCSDGVLSAKTGLHWSHQACNEPPANNHLEPGKREPRSESRSPVFKILACGTTGPTHSARFTSNFRHEQKRFFIPKILLRLDSSEATEVSRQQPASALALDRLSTTSHRSFRSIPRKKRLTIDNEKKNQMQNQKPDKFVQVFDQPNGLPEVR